MTAGSEAGPTRVISESDVSIPVAGYGRFPQIDTRTMPPGGAGRPVTPPPLASVANAGSLNAGQINGGGAQMAGGFPPAPAGESGKQGGTGKGRRGIWVGAGAAACICLAVVALVAIPRSGKNPSASSFSSSGPGEVPTRHRLRRRFRERIHRARRRAPISPWSR